MANIWEAILQNQRTQILAVQIQAKFPLSSPVLSVFAHLRAQVID